MRALDDIVNTGEVGLEDSCPFRGNVGERVEMGVMVLDELLCSDCDR